MKLTVDGKTYQVEPGNDSLTIDGVAFKVRRETANGLTTVLVNGKPYKVDLGNGAGTAIVDGRAYEVSMEGAAVGARRTVRGGGRAKTPAAGGIKALMPGKVIAVRVKAGDRVATGDVLVILEAMKMENEIRSPIDGIVKDVAVRPGSNVDKGDTLVAVEQAPAQPA